jgi:hypothetical protein
MTLLSPEKFAEAVEAAEESVSEPEEVFEESVDAVEAKEDSAETVAEVDDPLEEPSGDEAELSAGSEDESTDDDGGYRSVLSEEDEAWLSKYMGGDSASDDDLGVEPSEMDTLIQRISHLERDRAVALAERKLRNEISRAYEMYPEVSPESLVAAVQTNPYLNVESWAKIESGRVKSVEARIEARLREELKVEKRASAGERSPPRGSKANSSAPSTKSGFGTVADATNALRRDLQAGKFG